MIRPSEWRELEKLCLRSFPERLEQRISQFESLDGQRHPMRGLALSWHKGQRLHVERLILRRYADRWTWWALDDSAKAQREWTVVRWLYGQGLPVPRLYAHGSEGQEGFLLMARAPGRVCAAGQPAVEGLAACLARLHRLAPPDAVRQTLPQALVAPELQRLGKIARQLGDRGLAEALSELLTEDMEVYPPCVLHGDPHFANVLCDARGITALLDWENGALGDPRWDVARTVNWLHAHQAGEWVDPFCAAYAEHAAQPPSTMSFWETLTAVQNWAVTAWASAASLHAERSADVDAWRGRAWRALTRLRYERRERAAVDEQPLT